MSKLNADKIIWTDNTLNELRGLLGEIEIEFSEEDLASYLDFPWPITIKSVGHDEDGATQSVYAVISFDAVDGADTYEVRFSPLDQFKTKGVYNYGFDTTNTDRVQAVKVSNDIIAIFRAVMNSGTVEIHVRYMDLDAMTVTSESILHSFNPPYDLDAPHSPYDDSNGFKAYELKNGNAMIVINVSQFFIHDESYARIYKWNGSALTLVSSTTGGSTGFTHRDSTPVNYNFPGWSLGSPNSYEFGNVSDTGLWAKVLPLAPVDECFYVEYPGFATTSLTLPVDKLANSTTGGRYGWQQWVDSKNDSTKTYMLTNDTSVVADTEELVLVKLNVTPSAVTVAATSSVLTNDASDYTGILYNAIDVRYDEKVSVTVMKSPTEYRTVMDVFNKKIAVDFTPPDGLDSVWTAMGTRYAGVVYVTSGRLNWYFISPGEYL